MKNYVNSELLDARFTVVYFFNIFFYLLHVILCRISLLCFQDTTDILMATNFRLISPVYWTVLHCDS